MSDNQETKPKVKPITIASRGSKLALWQANYVRGLFESHGFEVKIDVIKTTGDRIQDRFLHEIGGKGLFVKEIEQALLDKKAHLAIHSLKDLPAKTPTPFSLAAILKRHEPTDVLIFKKEYAEKIGLEKGCGKIAEVLTAKQIKELGKITIATGSLRRNSLLKEASKEIEVIPIRGNVDTRLDKLEASNWHGLILAEASLERLNLRDEVYLKRLDPEWFTPSAAQGALVIETRSDEELCQWIGSLGCEKARRDVTIERLILEKLGGDCTMPFGCYFSENESESAPDNKILTGAAVILDNEGNSCRGSLTINLSENLTNAEIADKMLDVLKANGANKVLKEINLPSI